jgi:hypothetical protein
MQTPQIGGKISAAKILRLQEEARRDGQIRLARQHRRASRPVGAWRQAIGMQLVDAGIRLLGPSTEAKHSLEAR